MYFHHRDELQYIVLNLKSSIFAGNDIYLKKCFFLVPELKQCEDQKLTPGREPENTACFFYKMVLKYRDIKNDPAKFKTSLTTLLLIIQFNSYRTIELTETNDSEQNTITCPDQDAVATTRVGPIVPKSRY